jgi:heat shock protein HslJ
MPVVLRPGVALALLLVLLPGVAVGQPASPSPIPAQSQSALPASRDETGGLSLPRALGTEGRLPLEGTRWRLTTYQSAGGARQAGPEVAAWLTLSDGRLLGSGGCTPLRGRYAHMGDAIAIRPRSSRRLDCVEQTVLVERSLRRALRRATGAAVVNTTEGFELVMSDGADDELLRFVPDDAATLEAGEWRLARSVVDDVSVTVDASQPAVLAFHARSRSVAERRSSGELIGSSGCNGMTAGYSRSGGVLVVSHLEVTDAPCPPRLTAQEATIRSVLDSDALRVDLPPDQLVLSDLDTGDRLEYLAAAPLEGGAWRWREPGTGSSATDEPVTLRLDGGAVSGWGPCGDYVGTYATDGRFLTIGGLAGASSCRGVARQRRLFADLAATVLVERVGSGLRFLDARGRVVARFSPAAAGP